MSSSPRICMTHTLLLKQGRTFDGKAQECVCPCMQAGEPEEVCPAKATTQLTCSLCALLPKPQLSSPAACVRFCQSCSSAHLRPVCASAKAAAQLTCGLCAQVLQGMLGLCQRTASRLQAPLQIALPCLCHGTCTHMRQLANDACTELQATPSIVFCLLLSCSMLPCPSARSHSHSQKRAVGC